MKCVKICRGAYLLMLVLVFSACAAHPRKAWHSEPTFRSVENKDFLASLEPVHDGQSFYTWFRLTISNKSEQTLKIDWNKTRYLLNGQKSGGFVFEGIEPVVIKSRAIPYDYVSPGEKFTRLVTPGRLVAIAPMRDRGVSVAEGGISPGLIPAGENGMLLVIFKSNEELREKLILRIVEKPERK